MAYNFAVDGYAPRRRFKNLSDAENYARSQRMKTTGDIRIESLIEGSNGRIIAEVRKDAFDRVWTDIVHMEGSLL